jgi:chemotaxis protein MotB
MRRQRRQDAHHQRDRWLVSYADFITLLFAFFVVLYSAAQVDKRRAAQVASAIQTAFHESGYLPPPAVNGGNPQLPNAPATSDEQQEALKKQIEQKLAAEISSGDVAVRSSTEGLVISLREVGFFDSGSAEIKASSAAAFAQLAEILRDNGSNIRIEGHTDNVPIHNSHFSSNWDLSTARATATIRLLINYKLKPELMAAAGYAEFHPVAGNDTAEGRANNRRVDIVVPRKPAT